MPVSARSETRVGERAAAGLPRHFEKNPHLPLLLYYWRYFDVDTLQTCLPDTFKTQRTTQHHLQRWRDLGYVKAARPGYQQQQLLYSVTRRTIAYLAWHFGYNFPVTPDATVSPFIIEHERQTSRFQSRLYAAVQARRDLAIPQYVRRFGTEPLTTFNYPADGRLRTFKPDLAYLLIHQRSDGRRVPSINFIETDMGNEDMGVAQQKLVKYQAWYGHEGKAKIWHWFRPYNAGRSLFRLFIITRHRQPDGDHFRQLVKWYTQALLLERHFAIFVTTFDDLERAGINSRVWYPLHAFPAEARTGLHNQVYDHKPTSAAYDQVAGELGRLESLYTLLPPEK